MHQIDKSDLKRNTVFEISSGSIELLKWIGLCTMSIDHWNTFYFNSEYELMRQIGRIAFPLFVVVISYNIATLKGNKEKKVRQIIPRLFFFGLAAVPAIAYFKYSRTIDSHNILLLPFNEFVFWLLPLNVMFTFITLMVLLLCCERAIKRPMTYTIVYCFVLVALAGVSEYGISASLIGTAIFVFFIEPLDKRNFIPLRIISLTLFIVGYLILVKFTSNSLWPIVALPIIYIASKYSFKAPRAGHFFYAYYPLHISVIVLLATLTGSY